jgi:hypothetical protein
LGEVAAVVLATLVFAAVDAADFCGLVAAMVTPQNSNIGMN